MQVNTMDVRFKAPANFYICGQSQGGKSYLVRSMLRHAEELFNPVPTKIIYCYGVYKKEFEQMLQSMPNLTLVEGFPDNLCEMTGGHDNSLRPFSIAVALPAQAERTLLNFLCSCLTCAFFVRLNARGHAMKVELHSTFLACPGD